MRGPGTSPVTLRYGMEIESQGNRRLALDRLGFRPFFLAAGAFGTVSVAIWVSLYHFRAPGLAEPALSAVIWHAHEMIYGYAVAVVGGFLLTATRNWTGVQTLHGTPLILLAVLWLLARAAPFVDHPLALETMAVLDLTFNLLLCSAILYPIARARQWKQLGLWSKVVIVSLANLLFYLGLFGMLDDGVRLGLYTGLYLILSLILVVGRRVIPFFIERGVGYPVALTNRRWVDISSMVLMLIFIVTEVLAAAPVAAAVCAAALALLHAARMTGWHTPGLWRRPLLWVLYIAYGWIVLGFALTALAHLAGFNPALAVHAFAYGGIGMMTLGMMARVSLGHTGRDLARAPGALAWAFSLLAAGSVVRVILPLMAPDPYVAWIALSQALWIAAFALFTWTYTPILVRPRVDGRDG